MKDYTYRITIKPWYPSYNIERAEANTDKWEIVENGASVRPVLAKLIHQFIDDIFATKN